MMTPRDIFGILVRTVGLLVALYALNNLQTLFLVQDVFPAAGVSRGRFFVVVVCQFVFGLLLLAGPNVIVSLAYPVPIEPKSIEPARPRPRRRRKPRVPVDAPDFDNIPDEPSYVPDDLTQPPTAPKRGSAE